MIENRFPYFRTFLTSFGFFTINLTWSAFSIFVPIFLKNNLSPLLGDTPILYTLVGLIMVLDNLAAILMQPFIGSLSDRIWVNKLGRRMPFVIIGIPLAALFFGLIGTFQSTLYLLLIAICGFNISMAIYNTPVISLIPDTLPKEYHSQGNGVMNIVGGLANITGLLLSSYLYSINHQYAFFALSGIMIICLIILLINVRERRDIDISEETEKVRIFESFKQIIKERKIILLWMLIAVFMHNAGYQVAETFFSSYATDILGFSEERAGYILGAFVIIQIVLALPAGLLARKVGALNSSLVGIFSFMIIILPISIISLTDVNTLIEIITLNNLQFGWSFLLYGFMILVMGFGWILLAINVLVVVWNIAPKNQIATYTSLFYVVWNLAAILSPFIAGGIFDLVEVITGHAGLRVLFVIVLGCYTLSTIFLSITKTKQSLEFKAEITMEHLIEKRIQERDLPFKFLPLMLFGVRTKKEEDIQQKKMEYKQEKVEIKQKIKEIRKSKKNNQTIDEIEIKKSKQQSIKEQKILKKEKVKEYKSDIKEMKEEVLSKKIKEKIKKDYQNDSD
ncbi:MAG: MFS transporter [Candidatus Thorarchaeota archaeon]